MALLEREMAITSNVLWDIEQVITTADFTELNLLAPTLDPRITFSRTTTKSYIASDGTRQIAAANVWPREFDPVTLAPLGRSVWEARTNLFLNSDAPVTQSVTVDAFKHTLSFEGTGTITLSGAATGSLVGGGAGPAGRRSLTVTTTAGSLTATVSGSVQAVQIEKGHNASPYIATGGTAVVRDSDSATIEALASIGYSTSGGTWYAEGVGPNFTGVNISNGSARYPRVIAHQNASTPISFDASSGFLNWFDLGSGGLLTANATTEGAVYKAASAYDGASRYTVLNGGAVASAAGVPAAPSNIRIGAENGTKNFLNTHLRRIRYFPTRLSNTLMQQITTL